MGPLRLSEKLLPHRPIFGERLLRFLAVRNDAFLVSFAAHTQDTLFLLDVDQIQAGKFTDPQPCSIKKLKHRAVAAKQQAFFGEPGLAGTFLPFLGRSEERRVGKESRSRWSPYH